MLDEEATTPSDVITATAGQIIILPSRKQTADDMFIFSSHLTGQEVSVAPTTEGAVHANPSQASFHLIGVRSTCEAAEEGEPDRDGVTLSSHPDIQPLLPSWSDSAFSSLMFIEIIRADGGESEHARADDTEILSVNPLSFCHQLSCSI
ncbi:hypothetical protein BLNAU_23751 [Blattamonas nauphoetae]|uniref:Uncharacterized protein n=1 Tax=Blattamonas nauphoetae TaxID=2049346 RepID=A0ABQ9WPF2_9EUKA|nr:hypothetical protein BLNAU_23751 [Blattamonas nauphoetae]